MTNDYASIHAHYSATYRYLGICQRKLTAPQPLLDSRGRNRQGSQSTPTPLACILCAHCSYRSLSFTATRLGLPAWGFSLFFLFLFRLWHRLVSQIQPRGLSEGFTRSAGLESPIARHPTR
jgi:hypothetical protein